LIFFIWVHLVVKIFNTRLQNIQYSEVIWWCSGKDVEVLSCKSNIYSPKNVFASSDVYQYHVFIDHLHQHFGSMWIGHRPWREPWPSMPPWYLIHWFFVRSKYGKIRLAYWRVVQGCPCAKAHTSKRPEGDLALQTVPTLFHFFLAF